MQIRRVTILGNPVGYTNKPVDGDYFTILTPGGSSDPSEGKTFNYSADWDWGEGKLGEGYWMDYASSPITPHGAGDIQLPAGQGVLFKPKFGSSIGPKF